MKLRNIFIAISLLLIAGLFIVFKNTSPSNPKEVITDLLQQADIRINGDRPWDITVHNDGTYARVLAEGSLGLGESYMDGWWDCPALDQFFFKLCRARLSEKTPVTMQGCLAYIQSKIMNLQSKVRAFEVAEKHYDLSNELFQKMLDSRMLYSCGYWKRADNLEQAQEDKIDLICRKLNLKPGMKLLDIGCGWGGLAKHAAQKYGAHVVGITVSKEQAAYAKEITKGLPVEIRLQDYRDLTEKFDRITSVGMFEHVGYKNYATFMQVTHKLLADDGIMLLHTIGTNGSTTHGDAWINKYIFPNGMLPSVSQIATASECLFVMEDWHNFGPDYDKTLMAWHANFEKAWPTLKDQFDERFYRMWNYYLLSCAGLFRARDIQLWQVVFSKHGVVGGYESVR